MPWRVRIPGSPSLTLGLAIWVSRRARFAYPECASLCFATLARNSPVALAIAVVAFPERPLMALALVVGPLIELPVLALTTQVCELFDRGCTPRPD